MLSVAIIAAVLVYAHFGHSQVRSYYSGDAVNFNNRLYVASTNSGSLEVFRLEDDSLRRLVSIQTYDARFGKYNDFYDVKLNPENGHLYVYAISGFTFYKYELVNDNRLTLVGSRENTYWEWYNRVDKFGDDIVTISEKGVKVWNTDIMDVVDSLPVANAAAPYNVRSFNGRHILNVEGNYLGIYDRETRAAASPVALNYKTNPGNRAAYQDDNQNIYVMDDYYAKKFSADGVLLGSYRHLDYSGYDMAASGHTDYVYFSNGLGVVKLDKQSMKPTASRETTGLGGPRGWAMGLKVAYVGGDKVVVFNNSNILVLDDKLAKLASYEATEEAAPTPQENLYLNLDHYLGAPNATVALSGGGFFPREELTIDFAGTKTHATADGRGRFSQVITVPNAKASRVDIRVSGDSSQLHYSIAFDIQ